MLTNPLTRADFLAALISLCVLGAVQTRGASAKSTADDVLKNLKPDHPRLLVEGGTWDKIKTARKTDPLLNAFLTRNEAEARGIMDAPVVIYKKDGKRLLHVSRVVLRRVLLWALQYHLTGDTAFAKRAETEMLAVSAFADWNPSHFLDVGEMTLALAIGYDWLFDVLDPASRKTIETAIKGKGLAHGLADEAWQKTTNNWNSVCWGGITLGALALADLEPETAKTIVQKCLQLNGLGMKPYAPDGVYPEGAMYWGYGTSFEAILIAGLESALGSDFGLRKSPGFMESGAAVLQQLGPTNTFFNFSDGVERPSLESGMWWYAHTLKRPDLLRYDQSRLAAYAASKRAPDPMSENDRLLPLAAIWWIDKTAPEKPAPLAWYGRGPNTLAVFRSKWDDPRAQFLAVKAGGAQLSHGHMDAGSFVYEANGVRWAADLGMQDYLSLESKGIDLWNQAQTSPRWDVFRLGPFVHNTLTIDKEKHNAKGKAKFDKFGDTQGKTGAVLDLSDVFAGQAQTVRRGFAFDPNGATIVKDELTGLKNGAVVRWAMLTRAEAVIPADGKDATLTQNKETLRLTVQASIPTKWEIVSADPPPNAYDVPNPGAKLLIAYATAPANGNVEITVTLNPGGVPSQTTKTAWAKNALAKWPLPGAKG